MKLASSWLSSIFILLVLWTSSACAQPKNQNNDKGYEKDWKAIQKLEQTGLVESALESTEKLYKRMRETPNHKYYEGNLIKALLIMNKLRVQKEEDGLVKAIARLESEAKTADFPTNVILRSILGELYSNYLRQNMHKFSTRTTVSEFDPEDIQTWDLRRLTNKIYELYQLSLVNKKSQNIALQTLDPILTDGSNTENLRPTLYDFLLHRALAFYQNDQYYLTQPAYKFYLDEVEDFAPAQAFAARKLTAKDSLSPKFQAMLLFQEGLKFHKKDKKKTALVDLNLVRLKYVYEHSVLPNKDELFETRLKALSEQYKQSSISALITYELANLYYIQGQKYQQANEDPNRWKLKEARALCNKAIELQPKSYGASLCKQLRGQIDNKALVLTVEKVVSVKKESLASISYKNVDRLYFKVVPTSIRTRQKLRELYGEELVNFVNKISESHTWKHELPNEGDFQSHRTEIAIPALPQGRYLIIAATDKDFRYNKNAFVYAEIYVSNLRVMERENDYKRQYGVIDATTGFPVAGAKVEFFIRKRNAVGRSLGSKIAETSSDRDGFFNNDIVVKEEQNISYTIKIMKGDDILHLDNTYSNYKYNRQESTRKNTHFFLDRAIYRPGQTIYFKGLVLATIPNKKIPELITKEKRTVTLYDANYQKVTELELTTNDYGSFNGSFLAPTGGLLGDMHIQDEETGGQCFFKVEEYKRPKFEVTALPIKESFKLGDLVTVKGQAKAYAGNLIDGATVRYRVVRQVSFPYWNWRWGWSIPFRQEQQQMTFGETTTDDKGEYSITFEAQPDRSIPADKKPSFSYLVYADVVDITGETHSATSSVRVGYITLDLSINVPELLEKNQADSIAINSQNLNGQFEAAKGSMVIEHLKTPETIYKDRFWDRPDYYILKEADFKKKFPYFPYKDENKKETWAVEKTVLNTSFNTEKNKTIALKGIKKWQQGAYKVTVKSQDKFGEAIEFVQFFTLYDAQANRAPTNEALFLPQVFTGIEPDTTLQVRLGSADLGAKILYEVEHDQKIVERHWIKANGIKELALKVQEKHRGNLHLHMVTVQQGRFYKKTKTVHVPWSNKKLNIEYATFRDKLYPGQEETWTIKISGSEGEKVSAELLASMYDASLDAFATHDWNNSFFGTTSAQLGLRAVNSFTTSRARVFSNDWNNSYFDIPQRIYPTLDWQGFPYQMYDNLPYRIAGGAVRSRRSMGKFSKSAAPMTEQSMMMDENAAYENNAVEDPITIQNSETFSKGYGEPPAPVTNDDTNGDFDEVSVRTNLDETVFFFPELKTDKEGNLLIEFTMNEALTRWKFQLFGHTKDMSVGYSSKTIVTQKDLMVVPNAPRFVREGDELHFTAKVSNLTEKDMKGSAKLMLFDALTMKPLDKEFALNQMALSFDAKAGGSAALSWKIKVPNNWVRPIAHRVVAKSGSFSDGEEATLPVLTNRMLVTETQPLPIRGKQTKMFDFKRMRTASQSNTLTQHKLTLEFTQNPAWYALQALPYLMEYPYECTEQIFSRYYANSLASDVANSHPKIKRVFDQWKDIDTEALQSNLSKNEELKYALLEETPWVLNAQSEELQKKNIGILFDLNRMGNELTKAKRKIIERQSSNGGFSWMSGGRDSWYITQYMVQGFGRLQQLGVEDFKGNLKMQNMLTAAVGYIDNEFARNYKELLRSSKQSKDAKKYLAQNNLSAMVVHYFYARSFFASQKITNDKAKEALAYYEEQAKKYWNEESRYLQGMLALGLHRWNKDAETVQKIIAAARENALHSDEMGMYWKYPSGYYWYQLPIETHALMIELFDVVAQDEKAVEELKIWLLKAKQTTHWKTTKATAAACYALLRTGDNWLLDDQDIDITIGGIKLDQSDIKKEAGTGYFKTTWEGKEITPKMAKITVSNPNKVIAWGAMYWQYFENLDKITHFAKTPLKLNKKVFKKENTDRGPVLTPIEKTTLSPGDLLTVRVELRVDRNMEYVHMKDMRASGLEPTNVLSQYKYQGGLGYYETTKDASTNFFFDYLSKGTYVFEYDLRVNHKGEFSNGVTTIQCMYAPEYTAHSEGVRITVK